MNRRGFFGSAAALASGLLLCEQEPVKAYSFIRNNPLARDEKLTNMVDLLKRMWGKEITAYVNPRDYAKLAAALDVKDLRTDSWMPSGELWVVR